MWNHMGHNCNNAAFLFLCPCILCRRILCFSVWINSSHTGLVARQLNYTMWLISGTMKSTSLHWLSVLGNMLPLEMRRRDAFLREDRKIATNATLPVHKDLPQLRPKQLKPRKPSLCLAESFLDNEYSSWNQWLRDWNSPTNEYNDRHITGCAPDMGGAQTQYIDGKENASPEYDCGAPVQTVQHIHDECLWGDICIGVAMDNEPCHRNMTQYDCIAVQCNYFCLERYTYFLYFM